MTKISNCGHDENNGIQAAKPVIKPVANIAFENGTTVHGIVY